MGASKSRIRNASTAIAVALATLVPAQGFPEVPAGYPPSYKETIAAARKEGKVIVHATTDLSAAAPLNRAFEALYPGIKVEYREIDSQELYRRFVTERSARQSGADILWSSAMDLQLKLVNDGHAQAYSSPEKGGLPAWAVWKDEAYGTTYEPVVFVYNERNLRPEEVPQSHADLARLLKDRSHRFKGRITTYDLDRTAVGFLFATQDSRAMPGFWSLARLFGENNVRFETSSAAMMEAVGSGSALLAYNAIGSYAMARAKLDPSIGVVLPKDYTLVLSRVAFIAKGAPNPSAARLWLDFMLSRRGQSVLATKSGLLSVRNDLPDDLTGSSLAKALGASLRPIGVGPGLLVYLDRAKQQDFLKQWREATTGTK